MMPAATPRVISADAGSAEGPKGNWGSLSNGMECVPWPPKLHTKIFIDKLVSLSVRKNGSTASHLSKRTWEKLNKHDLEKF